MPTIRNLMKIMPNDSFILIGLAGGVYAYGAMVSSNKMRQEFVYFPKDRQARLERLERKFDGTSSV